jgi:hypothetical protein
MEVGRRRIVPGVVLPPFPLVAVVLVDGEGEPARYGARSWKSGPRASESVD